MTDSSRRGPLSPKSEESPESPDLASELLEAARLAVIHHQGQTRRGSGHPYAVHPLRVAGRVPGAELPAEADRRVAALAAVLRDTLEDTEPAPEQIATRFGDPVLAVVRELTRDKSLPKPERRRRMLEESAGWSLEAQLVKLADRWDNMSEMGSQSAEFKIRDCREAEVMLDHLAGLWPAAEAALRGLIAEHPPPDEPPERGAESP